MPSGGWEQLPSGGWEPGLGARMAWHGGMGSAWKHTLLPDAWPAQYSVGKSYLESESYQLQSGGLRRVRAGKTMVNERPTVDWLPR